MVNRTGCQAPGVPESGPCLVSASAARAHQSSSDAISSWLSSLLSLTTKSAVSKLPTNPKVARPRCRLSCSKTIPAAIVSSPPRVPPHHAATSAPSQFPKPPFLLCGTHTASPWTQLPAARTSAFPPHSIALPLFSAHARPPPGSCAVQCYSLHLRTCRQRSRKQAPHEHHQQPPELELGREVTPRPALLLVLG